MSDSRFIRSVEEMTDEKLLLYQTKHGLLIKRGQAIQAKEESGRFEAAVIEESGRHWRNPQVADQGSQGDPGSRGG